MKPWGTDSTDYARLAKEAAQREPDFAVVMLRLRDGTTMPTPVRYSGSKEPFRFTLDGARRRVRHVREAMVQNSHIEFAKPNSIVRVYLK